MWLWEWQAEMGQISTEVRESRIDRYPQVQKSSTLMIGLGGKKKDLKHIQNPWCCFWDEKVDNNNREKEMVFHMKCLKLQKLRVCCCCFIFFFSDGIVEKLWYEDNNARTGESQCLALFLKYLKCENIYSKCWGTVGEIMVSDES